MIYLGFCLRMGITPILTTERTIDQLVKDQRAD